MKILPNGAAVIEGDSHHTKWVEAEGLVHDKFAAGWMTHLILNHGVTEAIDVGAHIGTISRALIDNGCKVHAFEANPVAWACLQHNCPEADAHLVALGEKRGKAWLIREDRNHGAAYVSYGLDTGAPIEVATLDSFNLSAGLIKIDAEGFEVAVLKGAMTTLRRFHPVIYCEVNQGALQRAGTSVMELMQQFINAGYTRMPAIAQPDCDWDSPQFDIVVR